jgi:hypothetical protein
MTRISDLGFDVARLCQGIYYDKLWTEYEDQIANAVLQASRLAIQDVEHGRADVSFRVVSAPTGSGKSIGSLAVALAGSFNDEFSAAFVVETIRQVDELGHDLRQMMRDPSLVTVWSSGHDLASSDQKQAEVEIGHGRMKCPRALKRELRDARIVVVTHAQDSASSTAAGKRKYRRLIYGPWPKVEPMSCRTASPYPGRCIGCSTGILSLSRMTMCQATSGSDPLATRRTDPLGAVGVAEGLSR